MTNSSRGDVEDARRSLDELGYAVFRNVVSTGGLTELANSLRREYERALAAGELFEGGGRISGHLNFFPGEQARFVHDELVARGVIDLIGAIAPEPVRAMRVAGNFNLPGSVPQHYHSDGAYTDDFLICNIALVETNVTNGAIDVLPGTHKRFYKFWDYAIRGTYRLSTRLPLGQGDVLLRRSTLWHRGMPNRSSAPRPMMALTFGEKCAPAGDPFRTNDGRMHFFPNWYGTNRLGRIRERIFVTVPMSYSAYRFVRSLYGNKGYAP
jgi:ectoine hydroxylase-related dioxygenase (phytanoyl-CoA dioxygenase family)